MENLHFLCFFKVSVPASACQRWGERVVENEKIKGFGDGLRVENLHFCMIFQGFRARERLRGVGGERAMEHVKIKVSAMA